MESSIRLTVNSKTCEVTVDTRTLLVDFLRDHLGLTGTHLGCATGNCGACTVILNGLTVKSCTVLAVDADEAEVMTIEGFTPNDSLHPIQQTFVKHHALQCGFCTPGMVLSVHQLLSDNPSPGEGEIRMGIAGNLCRCTGYQSIIKAVQEAAQTLKRA
jgi:aerobic carbon-monoxide dehydrogenase small subunit